MGREQEVGLLMDRWEQVEEGRGQVVLVSGEPGIGKSRLLQAMNERLTGRPHIRREYRCSPYFQNSALHPIIEFLDHWLGFRREDTPGEKLAKLESALENYSVSPGDGVFLLASLLSLAPSAYQTPLQLSPEGQRERTREILIELLMETAQEQPVLFIFEDIHWADPSTLEFLSLLVEQVPTAQVLAMFTLRPEITPPWGIRGHVTQITLNRLPQRLVTDMMDQLTSGKELPEDIVRQIATKSDGVPLFVEELTRMVIESGLLREVDAGYELSGPLPALAIPSTLQDSLTARLDKLSTARESVQLAAVLGREFNYEVIRAVSPLDDVTLAQHLGQIVNSEFLYQRGSIPESTYIFKHALIQDAAYNSLLISRRQQYHQRVAQAFEERFAEAVESEPELLAHHYTEAGLISQAVSYWQRAGERALSSYAHEEAMAHFHRGLVARRVLLTDPGPAEDSEVEELLFGFARAKTASMHWQEAQEVSAYLSRAFDYYVGADDLDRAVAIAECPFYPYAGLRSGASQIVARALDLLPPNSLAIGRLLSRYGRLKGVEEADYDGAQEAFRRALALAQLEGYTGLEMSTLASAGNVDTYHLRYREAIAKSNRVIELSHGENDPESELTARQNAVNSLIGIGETAEARRHAEAMVALAETLRGRFWITSALRFRGHIDLAQGNWQVARGFSDRALAMQPNEPRHLYTRMILEHQVGEISRGQIYLDRLRDAVRLTPGEANADLAFMSGAVLSLVRTTDMTGHLDAPVAAAEAVLSSPSLSPIFTIMTRVGLGLLASWRGDLASAEEQYAAMVPCRNTLGGSLPISVDRVLGLLAQTIGNLDQSTSHYEDALAFCRKAAYRPELAWTCCDYADMLLDRNDDGDRAKANVLLDESLAISSELGMRPLMERVLARREILKA